METTARGVIAPKAQATLSAQIRGRLIRATAERGQRGDDSFLRLEAPALLLAGMTVSAIFDAGLQSLTPPTQ